MYLLQLEFKVLTKNHVQKQTHSIYKRTFQEKYQVKLAEEKYELHNKIVITPYRK